MGEVRFGFYGGEIIWIGEEERRRGVQNNTWNKTELKNGITVGRKGCKAWDLGRT